MKKRLNLLFILLLVSPVISVYAQKEIKGLPADLDKETIIFLEYEQLPIDKKMKRMERHMYKTRNKNAITSNKMLAKKVPDYPFNYVVSRRSEYKDSLAKTCRYVLENDLMTAMNDGVNLFNGYSASYKATRNSGTKTYGNKFATSSSPMYILDLKTGDKYLLFKINTNETYYYKGIMKKLLKRIKKKYKIKK